MNYRILYRTSDYQDWKILPGAPITSSKLYLNDFIKRFEKKNNTDTLTYQFLIVEYKS